MGCCWGFFFHPGHSGQGPWVPVHSVSALPLPHDLKEFFSCGPLLAVAPVARWSLGHKIKQLWVGLFPWDVDPALAPGMSETHGGEDGHTASPVLSLHRVSKCDCFLYEIIPNQTNPAFLCLSSLNTIGVLPVWRWSWLPLPLHVTPPLNRGDLLSW